MFKARMLLIGWIVLPLLAASCSSDNKVPQPPNVQPAQPPKVQPNTNVPQYKSSDAGNSNKSVANAPPQPIPPKGAQFTIFCKQIVGELHVQMAEKIRAELATQTPFKEWHVVHQESDSLLYYGYYRAIDENQDPKEAQRASLDRAKIAAMTDPMGDRPFRSAVIVELSAPDPTAPPEWNLANAPGDYSLQIGAYKDSPQRKEAAVQAVREARQNGVEAYFYHGPTMSMVCVGHWPKSAIRMEDDIPKNGDPYMVAPPTDNPNLLQQYQAAAEANGTKLVQPKLVVTDPSLMEMMKQYPYNLINGQIVKRVENGQSVPMSSGVVPIPRDAQPVAQSQPRISPAQSAYERLQQVQPRPPVSGAPGMNQPAPSQPQPNIGRLRSIGG